MNEIRNIFLGLDLDTSYHLLPRNYYVEALNITLDAVAGSQDKVVTNIVGNQLVSLSAGTNPYNIQYSVVNNEDGTQTVTFTFDTLPSNVVAVTLSFYDGANWHNSTGAPTSPRTYTMPTGSYSYSFTLEYADGSKYTYYLDRIISSLPAGTNKCIGAIANTVRNTVIYFVFNSNGNHLILEYDNSNRVISKVLESKTDSAGIDILNFTEFDKIYNVNIYVRDEGDLLFFLDSLGRPTALDITLFKAGTYSPVLRDYIDVAKSPSLKPPTAAYTNDITRRSNNSRNKLFRFKTRYVYEDFYKSTTSPISKVPLPPSILNDTFTNLVTNNNRIDVIFQTGGIDVKKIELLMSYVNKTNNWSDFELVKSLDKAAESIPSNSTTTYQFFNDSTYIPIDVNESLLDFDRVPDNAVCQEMPNGNILAYGGITEGYDRTLDPNVVITIGTKALGTVGVLGTLVGWQVNTQLFPTHYLDTIHFSGVPATGTIITLKAQRVSDGSLVTIATYTTVGGDTTASIIAYLVTHILTPSITIDSFNSTQMAINLYRSEYEPIGSTLGSNLGSGDYVQVNIVAPTNAGAIANDSTPSWKWSTERSIGIVYFDKKGKTNGVLYSAKVTFPAYAENGSQQPLVPTINVKIYHVPPSWAYSYQFVFTKEPTNYIYWHTVNVFTDDTYVYFDVSNFQLNATKRPTTAAVLSYTYQDSDRMRLIKRISDANVFNDTYDSLIEGLVVDPTINNTVQKGSFAKIKKVSPFDAVDFSTRNFIIEIYRPAQAVAADGIEAYFEFGEQYDILDPTLSTREHAGGVTNQNIGTGTPAETQIDFGDTYFRVRNVYITESGFGIFFVVDKNFVDFFISAVSSYDGRPTLIDVNARRAFHSALIRFGEEYESNTNVNLLNRFYDNNTFEVDAGFGVIRRMKARDRFIRIFQELKVGISYLYNQLVREQNGSAVQVVTDKLFNPIQYYEGDVGIGTNPESLSSYNYADYFVSNKRGWMVRLSNDGIIDISIKYKVNSWANDHLPLRTGNYKVYGAFDPKANNYIAALEATGTDDAYTLTFDEDNNVFESFLSFHPEYMATLGTLLISFKDGQLYTHDNTVYNNFYGVQYESYVTPVLNDAGLEKKTWIGITEVANTIWDCPTIFTNVNSYGNQRQETNLVEQEFSVLEANPTASLKRDINSAGGKTNGAQMKGNYIVVRFRKSNTNGLVYLSQVSAKYLDSPLTSK